MDNLIKEYIKNIDEYTINKYAKINDINLSDKEIKVLYLYIKNYWEIFYKGDPTELFKELEEQIQKENLNKIKELYKKYKEKIN
jgi:sulfur relay (sulfurtransferase) DsrC/TusE family protein